MTGASFDALARKVERLSGDLDRILDVAKQPLPSDPGEFVRHLALISGQLRVALVPFAPPRTEVCPLCGCVVADQGVHDRWHARIDVPPRSGVSG